MMGCRNVQRTCKLLKVCTDVRLTVRPRICFMRSVLQRGEAPAEVYRTGIVLGETAKRVVRKYTNPPTTNVPKP